MKLRITYILILMLMLTFAADAQRKKKDSKKPAKTSVNKKTVKKPAPKQTVKVKVKDSVDLKAATIEIVQSYKPEVKQATKPEAAADLPPVDTAILPMNYDVPAQSLYYTYNATPLRPLALGKDTLKEQFLNYVKLGGGNLSTLFLDAGFAGLKGRNYYTLFNVRHLSQSGSLLHQKSSMSGFNADGIYKGENLIWHAGLGVDYNKFNLYGYDNQVYNYTASQVALNYTALNITIDAANREEQRLSYHPYINGRRYGLNNGSTPNISLSEYQLDVRLPFRYTIDTTLQLGLAVNGMVSQAATSMGALSKGNNIFQLSPSVEYKKGLFSVYAALSPTWGLGGNSYLLPDIRVSYNLIRSSQFMIVAGWTGRLRQNRFEELAAINPYTQPIRTINQTHSDEIYGSLQTNIGKHITVSGRVSYWQYDNMPLFINDTAFDNKYFMVNYDGVNAVSLQGGLRYTVGQTLSVGGSIIYTTYDADINRYAWHEPSLKLNADVMIRPMPKLLITGYLSVLDGMYAVDKANRSIKLPTVFDLGAGAEYSFIPRLSAFARVNNIFNNQYERWYGYRTYGFNIFGGLRLKF